MEEKKIKEGFPEVEFEALGFSEDPDEMQKEIAEMIAKSKKLYEEKYGSASFSEQELESLDIEIEEHKRL